MAAATFFVRQMCAKFWIWRKTKILKPFVYRGFRTLLWGAWRIRTAVDGFADRWLSHSSKAPFLVCGCKGSHFFLFGKIFLWFFTAAAWIFFVFLHLFFQCTARTVIACTILSLYRAHNFFHSIGYGGDDDSNDDDDFHRDLQLMVILARTLFI